MLRRGRLVELLLAKLAHDRGLMDSLVLLQMFHRTERLLTLRTLKKVGDVERRRQNLDAQPFAAFGRRRRRRSVLLASLAAAAATCRRFRRSTPCRNRRREVALEQRLPLAALRRRPLLANLPKEAGVGAVLGVLEDRLGGAEDAAAVRTLDRLGVAG